MIKRVLALIFALMIITLSVAPVYAANEVDVVSYDYDYDYDYDTTDTSTSSPVTRIIVCVLLGMGAGFGIMLLVASKNKSVRMQRTATEYTRQGSFVLTGSMDNFLYRNVNKTPKPKNNNN